MRNTAYPMHATDITATPNARQMAVAACNQSSLTLIHLVTVDSNIGSHT